MDSTRTFSKEEISKILTKASQIQAKKDLYGDEVGLTEKELVRIAEDVGIDKDSLFEAIQGADSPELDSTFNWLAASSKIQDIQIVNGEIDDNTWEEVVQDIRRITGGIGKLNKVGKSFEWEQRRRELGYRHISLTPQNGNTKVQFVSNWRRFKITSSFLSFLFGFALSNIFLDGSPIPDFLRVLTTFFGGLLALGIGRIYLKNYFEKQKSNFKQIITAIGKRVHPAIEPQIDIKEKEVYGEPSSSVSSKAHRERS